MADLDEVARPYAQAVFELARDADDYEHWSSALGLAASVAVDPSIQALIHSPKVDREQLSTLFDDITGPHVSDQARNFIKLAVRNGRVKALPSVATQFEGLRAAAQGTVDAEVLSAQDVSEAQLEKLASSLEKRLGRKVNLKVRRDETLLGGAIVRAGDLVIDGSARGHLQKLASNLSR
ncbi:MAG: F0F1 ATP synthase subunit delta [Gammaproteobacteria bacterium]|nr:F0F1 ATP synthase subunit delta [Gammaproteobacteria bacterium]